MGRESAAPRLLLSLAQRPSSEPPAAALRRPGLADRLMGWLPRPALALVQLRVLLVLLVLLVQPHAARAQTPPNLAPGFQAMEPGARVLVAPLDVELFSLSAGGVLEPKADWTAAAQQHMKAALEQRVRSLGLAELHLSEAQADAHAEVLSLHGAVATAIAMHHTGMLKLPTKAGQLDWSFGDTLQPLKAATGARYALFTWVRDSYASAERKAMMVGMALLGIGVGGGVQVGYASLVDLDSGRVLWFNRLGRASGDLREAAPAEESVRALLAGFPGSGKP